MLHRSSVVTTSVRASLVLAAAIGAVLAGCKKDEPTATPASTGIRSEPVVQPAVGLQQRMGDEIVVAGNFYRIGTRVVTWMDPGGFDAYRTERRFAPWEDASFTATTRAVAAARREGRRLPSEVESPERFNLRYVDESVRYHKNVTTHPALANPGNWAVPSTQPLTPAQIEQVRGGGWPLDLLQQKVDQFVLHYDVAGTSANCFKVLHDGRGYSVQFMLDLDGTIYQTLDVKERAWQATKANGRSIGIEIANMGSYSGRESIAALEAWYKKDEQGRTYIQIPERLGGMNSQYTKPSVLRPARNEMVTGQIRGVTQRQYDLTPQQYEALPKLIAALCDVFPLIECDYPRDADGKPLMRTLTNDEFDRYQGVLGHYHVQTSKSDPGPAFQWEPTFAEARRLLAERRAQQAAE